MLALALGAGCEAPPEVAYVTERLEIAPDFDYPVCEGTLEHLDEHVTFVEDQLTRWIPPGERVRYYWLTQGVDGWCSEGATGCYYPGTRIVIANSGTVRHELVHAVLDAEAQTNLFLEEALAEVFSGVGAYHELDDGRPTPSQLLWLSREEYKRGDLDYVVASHFMSYLHRDYGVVPLRGLAAQVIDGASPDQLELEFAHEFDRPFSTIETEYVENAPSFFRGLGESQVPTAKVSGLPTEVELDCAQAHTYGPLADGSAGMFRVYELHVPVTGEYELSLQGDAELEVQVVDLRRQRAWGNVVDWHNPVMVHDSRLPPVRAGRKRRLELRSGRHLLVFYSTGYERSLGTLETTFIPPPDPAPDRHP